MKPAMYRSSVTLFAAITVLMVFDSLLALVGAWSSNLEIQLLDRAIHGAPIREDEGDVNDLREAAISMAQVIVGLTLYIAFLMWVYRSNKNARALGASDMRFGPGWSVGYYFIPILNLFRPYQATKEIWRGSHPDFEEDWQHAPTSPILPIWWALWIIGGVVNQYAFRRSWRADTLEDLRAAAQASIASELLGIPLALIAWLVVWSIYQMQEQKYGRLVRDSHDNYVEGYENE